MEKRPSPSWYIGATHVITAYIAACFLTFLIIFILATGALVLTISVDTIQIYATLLAALVFIPVLLGPMTIYSVNFITKTYVIIAKDEIIRYAITLVVLLELCIAFASHSSVTFVSILSFILTTSVFYYVSKERIQNDDESRDSIQVKDIVMRDGE